jgi:hypothetical protein
MVSADDGGGGAAAAEQTAFDVILKAVVLPN